MAGTTAPPACQDTQALMAEVQRLDGIAGVVLQTGFAVTAAAMAVAATGSVPEEVKYVLITAAAVCVVPTMFAFVAANRDPLFVGPVPDKDDLAAAYAKKKKWCKRAILILALTIEAGSGIILCMIIS